MMMKLNSERITGGTDGEREESKGGEGERGQYNK